MYGELLRFGACKHASSWLLECLFVVVPVLELPQLMCVPGPQLVLSLSVQLAPKLLSTHGATNSQQNAAQTCDYATQMPSKLHSRSTLSF